MGALVVYESMFGNTRAVAEAVAEGLRPLVGDVSVVEVSRAPEPGEIDVELLVVGAPTHAFGLPRAETRRDAAERTGTVPISATTGMREWLASAYSWPEHLRVAAFDTHVRPPLPGTASGAAVRRLRRSGATVIGRPESFHVRGVEGPLLDGELARARAWGDDLGGLVVGARMPLPV